METLEFNFFEPITQDLLNLFVRSLNNVPSNQPIRLQMASQGGDVVIAVQMYHFLKRFQNLTIEAVGNVDSAAIIVFLAGNHRTAAEHTTFLLHSLTQDYPSAVSLRMSDLKNIEKILNRRIEQYCAIFNERTASANSAIDIWSIACGYMESPLTTAEAFAAGILTTRSNKS